jgi:hypothetical protein
VDSGIPEARFHPRSVKDASGNRKGTILSGINFCPIINRVLLIVMMHLWSDV